MQDLTGKITGSTLTAVEWNQLPQEVQNVITALGITLGSGDLNQLGKAIAGYVANGTFYTDSGVADAYVLSVVGSKQSATAYTNGFEINFVTANVNTGASTVNVAGLGVKNIKLSDGGDPVAGDISDRTHCVFDSGNDWFELINPKVTGVSTLSVDKKQWPTIANAADTDHDITFSTGSIPTSDASAVIALGSAITKQIDAAWAEGHNLGGLFSGTVAADTTYHCFLIVKDSDGSIDAGFDTSLSAANIPGGYTAYRRIASIITDSSANIIQFTQLDDFFSLDTRIQDLTTGSPSTTGALVALSVPTGLKIKASMKAFLNSNAGIHYINIESPDGSNVAPVSSTTSVLIGQSSISELPSISLDLITDTSGRIRYRSSLGSADQFSIETLGWTDGRID